MNSFLISLGELELVCVCLNSNSKKLFYRARVIKYEKNFIKVLCLDFGFYATVKLDDIYEWNNRFNSPPILVYICSLANTNGKASDCNALKHFKKITRGIMMRAQVM